MEERVVVVGGMAFTQYACLQYNWNQALSHNQSNLFSFARNRAPQTPPSLLPKPGPQRRKNFKYQLLTSNWSTIDILAFYKHWD